ncbi:MULTISPECIES: 5-formyltetrahydrofolate cyclo-ligase [Pseudonocardia]|uniref:5-formyltetrahydrofolate cyclo-ligase n=2 Tax=Pseudonocardia TaxID=1847 RepID=A0A1Y2MKZ7_PSEAH|nr:MULTISPECIES: 5-formyltetrahydrofolate cyclo-ligase [Pseudonocardia]OSY35659.1 5-formyltetrahydrofolate cyclo-ligase family protein [Pseudonocardia autotrophica]TDN75731.1 5-formyltetrahydrofolate cyclo-ligase [Pseudonocardia autotrophica]BBF99700.1 5-formyltetrahydrofolate cyclo-ligase [Pseudonocardia autotrophica]GEC27209.1 5-formyltetrahydrofolate cyclo-ligase [Pseudonocardia saturnea]
MTARAETTDGSSPDQGGGPGDGKQTLRRTLLAARRNRSAEDRAAATASLSRHVISLASGTPGPVACYLPIGGEPGAAAGDVPALPDALLAAGHEVLVPVVPDEPGPLDWARYTGPDGLVDGPFGTRQPAGPRSGPDAVASAALVLVPALAVDRSGRRLGRGGGYYDRTLPRVAEGAGIAVLHDGELLDAVPAEPHDIPVGLVVLPGAGVVQVSPDR